jgi:hypothetical protein
MSAKREGGAQRCDASKSLMRSWSADPNRTVRGAGYSFEFV